MTIQWPAIALKWQPRRHGWRSSPHRFVWPSELDLMAQLADMNLRERWADWNETPFTADSRSHVSVWQKPPLDEST